MWSYINKLDQVIWLAENWKWAWYLNLFSRTRVNFWQSYSPCLPMKLVSTEYHENKSVKLHILSNDADNNLIQIIISIFSQLRNRSALAVIYWVINHCLEVSCKVDQITSTEREWFIFLQLTDKLWFIPQQITHKSWSISILTHRKRRKGNCIL